MEWLKVYMELARVSATRYILIWSSPLTNFAQVGDDGRDALAADILFVDRTGEDPIFYPLAYTPRFRYYSPRTTWELLSIIRCYVASFIAPRCNAFWQIIYLLGRDKSDPIEMRLVRISLHSLGTEGGCHN